MQLFVGIANIQTSKQPRKLLTANIYYVILGFRPTESIFLQSLMPQTKSILIPKQNFDDITTAVTKGEKITREKVMIKMLLYDH